MDADATCDVGLPEAPRQQPRRLQAPPLKLHAINPDTGWMSHAAEYTPAVGYCHYLL